jgi:iron(III) transport system substrate-binding protein
MYNTNLVKEDELPKSMFDLTDPKWRGQIGAADSTNGSMQGQIVAMRKLVGEEKTEEFVRGLVANDTKFFGGHTDVRKAVGAGELKLGLVNHYYYHLSRSEGAPVGIIYPDQGAGEMGLMVNSTNAGIIKGAPNHENAEEFVEYLLTPAGQKIFADLNFEYPVVEGVALAEGVDPLDNLKIANVELKTLGAEIGPSRELMERAGLP